MKLIFVYNADSGVFNTLSDIAHKIMSPKTYQCNLCQLTHGYFSVREEWVDFLQALDTEIEFLHRDEFKNLELAKSSGLLVEADNAFPAIFKQQGNELVLWMDRQAINALDSTDALKQAIKYRLQKAHEVDVSYSAES